MSERWARTALNAYRVLGSVFSPFSGIFLRLRARAGKEDLSRRGERFGYANQPRPDGSLVWFHAASVGEFMAILPLLKRLEDLGVNILVTTGTVTSAAVAAERLPETIIHQYVPIDIKPMIRRFLAHWKPDLAIFAESEIWPMTILELGAMHVPIILVNARISDRSYQRWKKNARLAEALFEHLAHVIAQSEIDARRYEELGAKRVTISGNLKVDTDMPAFDEEALAGLSAEIGERPVWIAASTHPGEEEIVADVHENIAKTFPDLLTVLVPRHPQRGDEVHALLTGRGHDVARRSQADHLQKDTSFLLGDTIGEMGLFLALGEVVFVGKSLTASGGQNPLEPAMMGSAILAGPNVQNFRSSYEALLDSGGVRLVRDGAMLEKYVLRLLRDRKRRRRMIAAAQQTVEALSGALERTFRALDYHVTPLQMKMKLERPRANDTARDAAVRASTVSE